MLIKIEGERLYSVPEIAIICGVSTAKVRTWVKNGELHKAHTVSNQGAIAIRGYDFREHLRCDPGYDWRTETIEISDDLKTEYLLAAKDKCMREISAADVALRKEMAQLNEILRELF